ncbi:MAG TPA: hypothetical protein VIM31_00575 [Candidatus Microsaccharimonas sp.]|jgi:predicted nucleic acid-binding OB-fold protein
MTESFRYEDTSSERVHLEDGQVEVFFDGGVEGKLASIILDTATIQKVSANTPYGLLEYDELVLANGSVLSPTDLSQEQRLIEFGDGLEPMVRLSGGALLRTIEYRRELKFLEIVRNDTTIIERKVIQAALLQGEQKRIPSVLIEQREIFEADEGLELWLRLEAVYDPDKALVGKIIMARLAYFMNHDTHVGIAPMIYNATDGITTRIPEQLAIHENWLYNELN